MFFLASGSLKENLSSGLKFITLLLLVYFSSMGLVHFCCSFHF
jgi:type IV secretory pathway TrbL component